MKVICEKEKLRKSVALAEKITAKNATLPILGTILLSAKEGMLQIRSTNLDVGAEFDIPAQVKEEGEVALSGSVLANTLSFLYGDGSVILELKNGNLSIETKEKKSSIIIKSHVPDDFPTIPKIEEGDSFDILAKDLISGVKSVLYSASVSDIKPEISSVYIYPNQTNIVFVATDSFRLSEKSVPQQNHNDFSGVIVPFKNIAEIIRIFEEQSGNIAVRANKNQISFYCDGVYVTSRLVSGVFPDYKQIIPQKHATEAVILKQDLTDVFKMTNIFSDKFNKVKFLVHPKEKTMELSSQNENGEFSTQVSAALSGDAVEINFNYKYIADAIQSIGADSVTLYFNGEQKPLIVRGAGDNSFLALIGPINK